MKDENGYYGRRLRQAYEEGRAVGMGTAFVIVIVVWGIIAILMKLG